MKHTLQVFIDSFIFSKVSEAAVLRLLGELNPTKGTGLDHLPARFLRDAAEVITPSIAHIFNMSIPTDELKWKE